MRLILPSLSACLFATAVWAQEPPILPEVATAYEAALATSVTPRRLIDEQRDWLEGRDQNPREPDDIDRGRIAELEARAAMDRAMQATSGSSVLPGRCFGQALSACSTPIGGYLTGPGDAPLVWQIQRGLLPDGQTEGHGLVIASAEKDGARSLPFAWVFGYADRLPPQYIERDGRRFLVLPARHDFLNDAEDVVFEWMSDASLVQIDTWSWREELDTRIPPGLSLARNVGIDMSGLTARTPLWLGAGDTDEPTGGEATFRFVLDGDRLVLDKVRVRDPLLEQAIFTPPEVFDYAVRHTGCNDLVGLFSHNTEDNALLRDAITRLRCDALEADREALKRAFSDRPDVWHTIARIEADDD